MQSIFSTLVILVTLLPAAARADILTFALSDHPNGAIAPPTYGLRLDDLIQANEDYTFSFDYADVNEQAEMKLEFNSATQEIRIFGRAYGGRDIGSGWDPAESGWVTIDFTYRDNVIHADNIAGDPGDDLYVLVASPNNNGFIQLDGWGGNATINYVDKARDGYSFIFDSDEDTKGNAAISNDPLTWSAAGWLTGHGAPFRDWLFIGVLEMSVGTDDVSVSELKARF